MKCVWGYAGLLTPVYQNLCSWKAFITVQFHYHFYKSDVKCNIYGFIARFLKVLVHDKQAYSMWKIVYKLIIVRMIGTDALCDDMKWYEIQLILNERKQFSIQYRRAKDLNLCRDSKWAAYKNRWSKSFLIVHEYFIYKFFVFSLGARKYCKFEAQNSI